MIEIIKDRWLLILVLAIFILFKIPHLHYPFYWDESWSYEPGVKLMYLHGPSLMPNAIDTFYSRGHPLLFYAAAASWMRLFGDSHVSQHSFSLFISVLLIISVYEVSNKLFNKRVALLALLILVTQVMFFVQASFVLPEVMVALLVLLTISFYATRQYLFTFLSCTALLFTKESGMVLGLILGVHAFFSLFNNSIALQSRLKQFLSVGCAGLTIACFFLLQKQLNGWYLFPGHTDMISFEWGVFFSKVQSWLDTMFFEDYRSHLFLLLLSLSLATALSFKAIRYAAPLFPGAIIYIIVQHSFPFIPEKLLFTFLLIAFAIAAYLFAISDDQPTKSKHTFIYLSFSFIVLYLCFSCINFSTARYVIASLIIAIILAAYYFDLLLTRVYAQSYYLLVVVVLAIGFYGIEYDTGLGDTDRQAFNAMKVQEDAVHYFERIQAYNSTIGCSSFQDREHLTKPFTGFLHTPQVFKTVSNDIDKNTDYALFNNIEPDDRYNTIKNDSNYRMVYRTNSKDVWAEIYKRK